MHSETQMTFFTQDFPCKKRDLNKSIYDRSIEDRGLSCSDRRVAAQIPS